MPELATEPIKDPASSSESYRNGFLKTCADWPRSTIREGLVRNTFSKLGNIEVTYLQDYLQKEEGS
jgi:hypothetical protein